MNKYSLSAIEKSVLMNAWEDFAPLWTLIPDIRGAAPNLAEPKKTLGAGKRAVQRLLDLGLVDAYRRSSRSDAYVRLEALAAKRAVGRDAYWTADEKDETEIAVAVTARGEKAHLDEPPEAGD
jgi:hypothetical protein